jgi:hypothetical protein
VECWRLARRSIDRDAAGDGESLDLHGVGLDLLANGVLLCKELIEQEDHHGQRAGDDGLENKSGETHCVADNEEWLETGTIAVEGSQSLLVVVVSAFR